MSLVSLGYIQRTGEDHTEHCSLATFGPSSATLALLCCRGRTRSKEPSSVLSLISLYFLFSWDNHSGYENYLSSFPKGMLQDAVQLNSSLYFFLPEPNWFPVIRMRTQRKHLKLIGWNKRTKRLSTFDIFEV